MRSQLLDRVLYRRRLSFLLSKARVRKNNGPDQDEIKTAKKHTNIIDAKLEDVFSEY